MPEEEAVDDVVDPEDEPEADGLDSPSILTTLLLTLFRSTPKFSKTLAATPSPSRIKPKKKMFCTNIIMT